MSALGLLVGSSSVPRRTSQAPHAPGGSLSTSVRESKSTLPGNRVRSLCCLHACWRSFLGAQPSWGMGSSYLAGGGGTWPPGDPALTPSPRVLASLPPLCSRPAGRRLFRLQGSGQAPRGSRPLCRPQWEVRGPRHRSGEQTGWQTAPADVGGGRGRRGKRVSGLPSALACPRLVVGWGSRTAPLESPGAPSTRADDLREGHFFSDPFWEGPLGVRHPCTHPSAEAEKTHDNQTRARACGCACVRACVCPRVRSQACCLWARV